ncbi:MAG TPA: M20 family metallopeptidase, partial [bacterium]|nr:M20 family metallopeptidase [bacterium]
KGTGKKTLLFRADIDALPVVEQTGLSYASVNPGVMHACGHDFNTMMVFGAALLLKESEFRGKIYFLFQPAEEDGEGALKVLGDRRWPKEKINAVIGVHIQPVIPCGFIGIKEGELMAAVDRFRVTIHGRGGHAAYPHLCTNPIDIFHSLYSEWLKIAHHEIPPSEARVMTVTAVRAGDRFNIIPETLELEGTVRTLDEKVRRLIYRRMLSVVRMFEIKFKIKIEFRYEFLGSVLRNHPGIVSSLRQTARACGYRVLEIRRPSMGGDDFAEYLKKYRGVYLHIGGGRKGKNEPWHSPRFNPEEKALFAGARFLKDFALRFFR